MKLKNCSSIKGKIITSHAVTSPASMFNSESRTYFMFDNNCLWCKMSNTPSSILILLQFVIFIFYFKISMRSDLCYFVKWCLPLIIWRHYVNWACYIKHYEYIDRRIQLCWLIFCKLIVHIGFALITVTP